MTNKSAEHSDKSLHLTRANAGLFNKLTETQQDLIIDAPVALDNLTRVGGNLIVTAQGQITAPLLTAVGEQLTIYGKGVLRALQTVGYRLYVYSGGSLQAPALVSVGDGLFIYPNASINARAVKSIAGGLSINSQADFPEIERVGGGLVINARTTLDRLRRVDDYVYVFVEAQATALTSVSGDLVVHPGAKFRAPALASVGKRLVIDAETCLDGLSSVGGDLYVRKDTALNSLTNVKGALYVNSDVTLLSPALRASPTQLTPVLKAPAPGQPLWNTENPWTGKKWAALGTSVTVFGAYTQPLTTMLGTSLVNLAQGGGSLSTSASSDPGGIYKQIPNIPADADLVTFEVGMTDFRTNATLGALYDTTLDTFYGALYKSISETLAGNPKRTLVFITPFGIASSNFKGRWNVPNENGNTMEQFVKAIGEVCAWCGIAVIDAGQGAGIGGLTCATYTTDGIHLNPAGGFKMAQYLYDRLIRLRPYPTLPGSEQPGSGRWTLTAATATGLSGSGLRVSAYAPTAVEGVSMTFDKGYYFSALWLTRDGHNAAEFVSLPNAGNGLWITLGCGDAGWLAVGDFGNLGAQRVASFEAAHGSVTFGELITAKYSVDPNESGMRWRVARSGTVVQIYQYRKSDNLWVDVGDPIDLAQQGFDGNYYRNVRIGILGNHGTVTAVLSGTYA